MLWTILKTVITTNPAIPSFSQYDMTKCDKKNAQRFSCGGKMARYNITLNCYKAEKLENPSNKVT